jgi:outer membrane receptor protein involved in Fe transport
MESSQQRFNMYSVNLDEATVKGVEINVRKSLGFLATAPFLQDLYISGNAALISGDVSYTKIFNFKNEDKRKRPLMGLAPYTVNAGLAYQGKALGAAVNYGRVGRTLVTSGDYEAYDQYERPRNVLDLQLSARFLRERLELKFNASDLLNEDIIVYRNCSFYQEDRTDLGMDYNEGDWVMSRIRKGVNLSLSASYRF